MTTKDIDRAYKKLNLDNKHRQSRKFTNSDIKKISPYDFSKKINIDNKISYK